MSWWCSAPCPHCWPWWPPAPCPPCFPLAPRCAPPLRASTARTCLCSSRCSCRAWPLWSCSVGTPSARSHQQSSQEVLQIELFVFLNYKPINSFGTLWQNVFSVGLGNLHNICIDIDLFVIMVDNHPWVVICNHIVVAAKLRKSIFLCNLINLRTGWEESLNSCQPYWL